MVSDGIYPFEENLTICFALWGSNNIENLINFNF